MTASPARPARGGFTLFEVLLAIAILAVGIGLIAELMSRSAVAAVQTQLESEAITRASSVLAGISSGSLPFGSNSGSAFEDDPNWEWSVTLGPSDYEGLSLADVSVAFVGPSSRKGAGLVTVDYKISQLVRDPAALVQQELDGLALEAAAAANAEVEE